MIGAVCCFALGCAAAAALYWLTGVWCFVLPPMLVVAALIATQSTPSAAQHANAG